MSRTDKDRPYWVRLNDPTEDRIPRHRHSHWYHYDGECNIDEPYTDTEVWWRRPCGYYLRHEYYYTPNREERREGFYGPMRRETRDTLRNAVKDYNTFGEIDEDFVLHGNHRHSAFAGGYWD